MKFDIEYLLKICRENFDFYQTLTRMTGTLNEDVITYIRSRSVLLRMINVSNENIEEIKTHFLMFTKVFSKNFAVYEIM
jgi:hypothetical protein